MNNVPEWMLKSTTGIEENDNDAALAVASYIGAFGKRGFDEKEMGIMMAKAFLLSVDEVEKRIDRVLSLDENCERAKKTLPFSY